MNKIARCYLAIIVIIGTTLLTDCKKEVVPVITTTAVSNFTATTATSGGNITDEGSSTVISRGVCWSTSTTPTIADNKTTDGAGAGSFTSNLTVLNAVTNYYVRAYASNSAGTGYGMAMSFTTLGQPPAPTVLAATKISATGATLNGSVNANLLSTVVTFEYGTTTSYGVTIAATPSPLTGNTNTNVSADVTGLLGGTTYHLRIKAVNSLGTTYSTDLTFTTLGQLPTATTLAATSINTTIATLNGTVNANLISTVVTFEYGTTTSYGTTATITQSPVTGNTNTNVNVIITALNEGTNYHYRIKAVNSLGTTYGTDLTFTTLGQLPTATTLAATNINTTIATLNGTVTANFLSTVVTFEYGTTASYGTTATVTQSPVTGNTTTNVNANISGLTVGTNYHYRVKTVNSLGVSNGSDMTFTTLGQVPTVITVAATNITTVAAQLNGTVNANYLSTVITFEYGTTTSYGTTATVTQSPVTGNTTTNVNANISGLTEGTTYHYKIVATNSLGVSNGSDMTFTTLGQVPTVITVAATNITTVAAQLNGTVNANYLPTVITFEYGKSTTYGSSSTATQSPLSGGTNTNVIVSIISLEVGTTYHYRIAATNSLGTSYSNDISFTTLGQVPTVITVAATNITTVAAQFNGNVNANYLESVVTFEYGTTTAYGNTVTAAQSPVAGSTVLNVSASISGLTSGGTVYHFRVKAVNFLGTVYGNDMIFSTVNFPTLSSSIISPITSISASGGGNITSDGGGFVTQRGVCWATSSNPTIADLSSNDGTGIGSFASSLTGLNTNTTYYVRAYATNEMGTAYGNETTITLWLNQPGPSVTDYEGNLYNSVKIGNQIWMTENLKATKFSNGTDIPKVYDNTAWSGLSSPSYIWYDNDISYKNTYGALYNWFTIDAINTGNKNVCPTGWHVPTDAEFSTLTAYLGGESVAGGKLKETSTTHWKTPNTGATNESGFTGLPGGSRSSNGTYGEIGGFGYWWTATEHLTIYAYVRVLSYYYGSGFGAGGGASKQTGMSIRCLKD